MNFLHNSIKHALNGHSTTCFCSECIENHTFHIYRGIEVNIFIKTLLSVLLFVIALILKFKLFYFSCSLFILSSLISGYDLYISSFSLILKRKQLSSSVLISFVSILNICIGQFADSALILLLYDIISLLQAGFISKTESFLSELSDSDSAEINNIIRLISLKHYPKSHTEIFLKNNLSIYNLVLLGIAIIPTVVGGFIHRLFFTEVVSDILHILIIGCPCLITLSVSYAYSASIACGAKNDVIFKGSDVVDKSDNISTLVFDENCIFDINKLRISAIKCEKMDTTVFLRIAAHITAFSDHPFAKAIRDMYEGPIYIELLEDFKEFAGKGVSSRIDGNIILLGTYSFLSENGIALEEGLSSNTSLFLAISGSYVGCILLDYEINPSISDLFSLLDQDDNYKLILLGEKSDEFPDKFSKDIGFDDLIFCNAGEKKDCIQNIIQDSDTGNVLYFSTSGSLKENLDSRCISATVFSSEEKTDFKHDDIILADTDFSKIILAFDASKLCKKIIKENLIIALIVKILLVVLFFAGCSSLITMILDFLFISLSLLNTKRLFTMNAIICSPRLEL